MKQPQVISEFYFFAQSIDEQYIQLSDTEYHHIVKVLRIKESTRITLTDGKGKIAYATIQKIEKHQIKFQDIEIIQEKAEPYHLEIAIAPTKNISRFEWFLEKATEIGVTQITPIRTAHSERKNIRTDRLEKILISATTQSQKAWKPQLNAFINFNDALKANPQWGKYIAYIQLNSPHLINTIEHSQYHHILIGPEGGFSYNELIKANESGYQAVNLGKSRLRTETAGMVASNIISIYHENKNKLSS